jgi:uncharacterized phage protein (TIGR01671 family)
MRTIKFRGKVRQTIKEIHLGKEPDDGTWVVGDYHYLNTGSPHIHFNLTSRISVDPDTVGEFTGLCDKNGKEIYEGDILHVIEWENLIAWDKDWNDDPDRFNLFSLDEIKGEKRKEYTSPVFWDEGGFCIGSTPGDKDVSLCCLFGDMKRSAPIFEFEIIGNIYDNPNLLKL